MSKNSIYTFNYFQPKEYRFSLDSVFLAQSVAKNLKNHPNIEACHFLDLCAGSGVVGLELSIHLGKIQKMDFLEVQNIYADYFNKNLLGIHGVTKKFNFIVQNYADVFDHKNENKYEYILSNPPYFFKDEGLLSPNEFKNRCRFFLDSDFETLIKAILYLLKPKGEAYILVRPGIHHGRDLYLEIQKIVLPDLGTSEIFDNVRGTNIVRIIKKS
jgi:tRNA1(Val) A37 N6-methylase TrmN6